MIRDLDRLLEAVLNADGEVRQELAESNIEALLSEPAFHRVSSQRDEALRRVKRLEVALAAVREIQSSQTEA